VKDSGCNRPGSRQFYEIIRNYRLKKASLLLRNKEGNISEIMYDLGFSNLSYFSKCFRSEFGLTPKDYQQKTSKSSLDIAEELKFKTMNEPKL
jgi:AraC-like DNA-binding protein